LTFVCLGLEVLVVLGLACLGLETLRALGLVGLGEFVRALRFGGHPACYSGESTFPPSHTHFESWPCSLLRPSKSFVFPQLCHHCQRTSMLLLGNKLFNLSMSILLAFGKTTLRGVSFLFTDKTFITFAFTAFMRLFKVSFS